MLLIQFIPIAVAGDLVAIGSRARTKVQLASYLGVDRQVLAGWIGQAQLLTLKGIDGAQARALGDSGISDLESLANSDPEEMTKAVNTFMAKRRSKTTPLTVEQAAPWRQAARQYAGKTDEQQNDTESEADRS